jgi:uncharacterized protein (TIGR03067 family)
MGSLVLLSAILLTGAPEAATADLAQLEGVWRFTTVAVNGKEQPAPPFETNKLIIWTGGRYVIVQGPRFTHGMIQLDPAASPKHYDVTVTGGPAKGLVTRGVYELAGETYRICLPLDGKTRPTAVRSQPGTIFFSFTRDTRDYKEALAAVGRQELAGRWQAVTYALDGKKATDEQMQKIQLLIDSAGKSTALVGGKVFIASSITVDPATSPMNMDVTFTEGDDKGTTSLGIYKIENGVLTICRAPAKKPRPTEFGSAPGTGLTLMTYKRSTNSAKSK